MAKTMMASGRGNGRVLPVRYDAGPGLRPRRRFVHRPMDEPTVQELNARLIHDMQCPHGDACHHRSRCEYTPNHR